MSRQTADVVGTLLSAVVAVDNVYGGDIFLPSGVGKEVGDCLRVRAEPPPIYRNPLAVKARRYNQAATALQMAGDSEGAGKAEAKKDEYTKLILELEKRGEMRVHANSFDALYRLAKQMGGWDGKYLKNMADSLVNAYVLRREELGLGEPVPLRDSVKATHGFEPELIDTKPMLLEMDLLLSQAGFDASHFKGSTVAALDAWAEQMGIVPSDQIEGVLRDNVKELERKTIKRIVPHLPKVKGGLMGSVVIEGVEGVHFSASSTYLGTIYPGRPTLFEYNRKIQRTKQELFLLSAHEFVPGHAFYNSAASALMEAGKRGLASAVGTMCTAETAFAEAHGEGTTDLLYTPKEMEGLSVNMKIAMLRKDLDGIAKHNTAILFDRKTPVEEMIRRNREEGLLSPEAAKRYPTAWTASPTRAKVYMFSYARPVQMFREAVKTRDRRDLIQLVYGVHGPVDIINFPEMVEEFCDKTAEA